LVVAGGASSRLGVDKRTLRVGGATLLERATALLAPVCAEVLVAAPADIGAPAGSRWVRDPLPDRGPMAGILAGLRDAGAPRVLVIPVDMPLLSVPFLRFLADRDPGAGVAVPRWSAGMEPLVAVYHRSCVEELAGHVARGTTALHAFIASTPRAVRFIDEPEILAYGEPARLFLNINTAEDLRRAEELLRDQPPPGRP
jgi:molybdopterin-guanine dinucleotide biosynthesis protein A